MACYVTSQSFSPSEYSINTNDIAAPLFMMEEADLTFGLLRFYIPECIFEEYQAFVNSFENIQHPPLIRAADSLYLAC